LRELRRPLPRWCFVAVIPAGRLNFHYRWTDFEECVSWLCHPMTDPSL
jgi:hypothetical protein